MFVKRRDDGTICAAWVAPQTEAQREQGESHPNWLPDDHPDIAAFHGRKPPVRSLEQKLAAAGLSIEELKKALAG